MQAEGQVGVRTLGQGSVENIRLDRTGAIVTADGHGRYSEVVDVGNVFFASNQAGVALTAGLGTTATGLIITNPPGSQVNLHLLDLVVALTTAPAGIATILLAAVPPTQSTETTHTTPLTVRNAKSLAGSGVGKADSAATLATTPVAIRAIPGGPVATGSVTAAFIRDEVSGLVVIPPGCAVSLFALTTAISVLASAWWEERPL